MTTTELLTNLLSQGFSLTPLPGDKLEVRPASKLTDALRQELKQRKLDLLAVLRATPLSLCCRQCNREARPDGGTLSQDQTNYIQFWRCLSCGAKGSTVFRLQ
jgi:hypothetical protein